MTTKLEQAAREVIRQHSMECLSDKAIDALRKALAEQAEQEPVATIAINNWGEFKVIRVALPEGKHDLYDAPVRTKDLTDEEKQFYVDKWERTTDYPTVDYLIDAVIAADREKNK